MPFPLLLPFVGALGAKAGAGGLIAKVSGSKLLPLVQQGVGMLGQLGGQREDKSQTGFQEYMASGQNNVKRFPSKEKMMEAASNGGWDSRAVKALNTNYNQSNGTFKGNGDDWAQIVISTNPIQVATFKGANERFILQSSVNMDSRAQSNVPSLLGGSDQTNQSNPIESMPVLKYFLYAFGLFIIAIGARLIFKRKKR